MGILEKIDRLLDERGVNQGELESLAGLPKGRVSRWLGGTGKPTAEQAFRIAKALKVRVEYLLDDEIEDAAPDYSDVEARILEMARILGHETAIRRLMAATDVKVEGPTYKDLKGPGRRRGGNDGGRGA
jgi:transcriptional regulator with XRE-family HTH domain